MWRLRAWFKQDGQPLDSLRPVSAKKRMECQGPFPAWRRPLLSGEFYWPTMRLLCSAVGRLVWPVRWATGQWLPSSRAMSRRAAFGLWVGNGDESYQFLFWLGFFFSFGAACNSLTFFTAASKSTSTGLGFASSSTRNFAYSCSALPIALSCETLP